jgi:hypothetical protein
MKSRSWLSVLVMSVMLALPGAARAASDDEDTPKHDARTEGYGNTRVQTESNSIALTWLLFIFTGGLALAALFKDAKRTHLD